MAWNDPTDKDSTKTQQQGSTSKADVSPKTPEPQSPQPIKQGNPTSSTGGANTSNIPVGGLSSHDDESNIRDIGTTSRSTIAEKDNKTQQQLDKSTQSKAEGVANNPPSAPTLSPNVNQPIGTSTPSTQPKEPIKVQEAPTQTVTAKPHTDSSADTNNNDKLDAFETPSIPFAAAAQEPQEPAWLSSYENYAGENSRLKFRYDRDTLLDAEILGEGSRGEGWLNLRTSVGEFGNVRYDPQGKQDGTYFFATPDAESKAEDEIRRNRVDPNKHP